MTLRRVNRPRTLDLAARQTSKTEESTDNPSSPDSPSPTSRYFPSSTRSTPRTTASSLVASTTKTFPTPIFFLTPTTTTSQHIPKTTVRTKGYGNPLPRPSMPDDISDGFIGKDPDGEGISLSPATQGILATFSILGGLCVIALIWFWFRRKNQPKAPGSPENRAVTGLGLNIFSASKPRSARPATTPSSPSLEKRIDEPESAHVPTYRITRAQGEAAGWQMKTYTRGRNSAAHDKARMTMTSNDETVVEDAIEDAPRKSVNPFEDPQLNKSYDMIHNRPRSTTLTDTGDWLKNPFEDPRDDRFDPFGTLRDRAKEERKKYIALLKAEREKHKDVDNRNDTGTAE